MKQFIIINNKLKINKRKIARLGHSAGVNLTKASSFKQRWKWFINNQEIMIMKTDKLNTLLVDLKLFKIKHFIYVESGSTYMVSFFANDVKMFNSLKKY